MSNSPRPSLRDRLELGFAVCGGPLAWLAQINLTYPLFATPCFPGPVRNLVYPLQSEWAFVLAVAVYVALLAIAALSALLSLRIYRRFQQAGSSSGDNFEAAGIGRMRFLAFSGMLLGTGFSGLLLVNALPLLLVTPCAL
jgi:hypothetical protein